MQKGCPKCGRLIDTQYEICPYCSYNFKDINMFFKQVDSVIIEEKKYAGFIKRLISGLIDIIVSSIITSLIMLPIKLYANFKIENNLYIIIPLFTLIYILYNSIFERTKWHGGLGKKLVGIEVTDEYENPETLGLALIRNIVKFLNLFTLGIGFILSTFTSKKQTLGDIITRNYVLSTINFNEELNFEFASPLKRFVAFIIDSLIIVLLIIITDNLITLIKNNINITEIIKQTLDSVKIIISFVICLFYYPTYESIKGTTPGKKIMRLKVTNLEGKTISFQKAFIRQFINITDLSVCGYLLSFTNMKKQTLKDKIMKTIVIDY